MEPNRRPRRWEKWLIGLGIAGLLILIILPVVVYKVQSWRSAQAWRDAVADTGARYPGWRGLRLKPKTDIGFRRFDPRFRLQSVDPLPEPRDDPDPPTWNP